jgi:hypothetical protein
MRRLKPASGLWKAVKEEEEEVLLFRIFYVFVSTFASSEGTGKLKYNTTNPSNAVIFINNC